MDFNKFSFTLQRNKLQSNTFNAEQGNGTNKEDTPCKRISQSHLNAYFKEIVDNILNPTNGMSEEKKAAYEEEIARKIKTGEKLTAEELRYIQLKAPEMYLQIVRVQTLRENLENRLKNCGSKQEVEQVYCDTISRVREEDPARDALVAAYKKALEEFKESREYNSLPEKMDDSDDIIKKKEISLEKEKNPDELYPYYDKLSTSYLEVKA